MQHEQQTVTVDGHITLGAAARVAVLVRELRLELQKLLARKVAEPAFDIGGSPLIELIVKLLTTDGNASD